MSRQAMITRANRPSSNWRLGQRITMLDAWMLNPTNGKVVMIPNADHVVMEDGRGVRHYGRTDRIVDEPTDSVGFTSLIGDMAASDDDFADLLG